MAECGKRVLTVGYTPQFVAAYIMSKETFMAFTKEDTVAKVTDIIEDKLNVPAGTVTLTSTFKDLGADSLDVVELIMSFEEEFGIEIRDEDAEKIQSVGQVADHIHSMRTK